MEDEFITQQAMTARTEALLQVMVLRSDRPLDLHAYQHLIVSTSFTCEKKACNDLQDSRWHL